MSGSYIDEKSTYSGLAASSRQSHRMKSSVGTAVSLNRHHGGQSTSRFIQVVGRIEPPSLCRLCPGGHDQLPEGSPIPWAVAPAAVGGVLLRLCFVCSAAWESPLLFRAHVILLDPPEWSRIISPSSGLQPWSHRESPVLCHVLRRSGEQRAGIFGAGFHYTDCTPSFSWDSQETQRAWAAQEKELSLKLKAQCCALCKRQWKDGTKIIVNAGPLVCLVVSSRFDTIGALIKQSVSECPLCHWI